jgi:hypothetical protein
VIGACAGVVGAGGITGVTGGIVGEVAVTSLTLFSVSSSIFGAAFLAAAFLAGAFLAGLASAVGFATGGNFSKNFLTTGGSTVDDAERTNSPISWSFARTSLLSIPTSFANS